MNLFIQLFREIDATSKTNEKVAALTRYFEYAEPKDAIWVIALLTGHRAKRPVATSSLRIWAAELAELPLWLLEESYYIVGDLAETISQILPEMPANDPMVKRPYDALRGSNGIGETTMYHDRDKSADMRAAEAHTSPITEPDGRAPDSGKNALAPYSVKTLSLSEIMIGLKQLLKATDEEKKQQITTFWQTHNREQNFIYNKLITGHFRMGVSRQLVIRALSSYLQLDKKEVARRIMGKWNPEKETMDALFKTDAIIGKDYLPYPFSLAYPLDQPPAAHLGNIDEWYLERKYDGIRGQIIVRNGQLFVWSRGEELMTDKFPEFQHLAGTLPQGTVIDGEIMAWRDGKPLSFALMQTRIGRKNISAKHLADAPLVMICYDILEHGGKDIRALPLSQRRKLLAEVLGHDSTLQLSPLIQLDSWAAAAHFRTHARNAYCEGLMIKRKDGVYEAGRHKGNWWKWKTDPLVIDGVLIYAQGGRGRRANLFTDYTFAVWDKDVLVPFAKAYSGLSDMEIIKLDNWIKRNTVEKFGPVRSVKPELVFEIAFEGINSSKRHKSGVALRFPRIARWRSDKPAAEANTKSDLEALLKAMEP